MTFVVVTSVGLLLTANMAQAQTATIVAENFGGTGTALNGTAADTFAAAITSAGGSGTWVAGAAFLDDGTVTVDAAQTAAYLNLGTYIDDAKGTATGKFDLTMTVSETVGEWISLRFTTQNAPSTTKNFTNTGSGATTTGIATIIRREIDDWYLDAFAGPLTANSIPGPEETGARTLTVSLDFTPAGGWDGTTNFGTVTFSDSVYGTIGSHTYTSDHSFGAVFISEANNSGGTISALTLTQQGGGGGANDFSDWIAGYPGVGGQTGIDDDPDLDGNDNGVENFFGTAPDTFTQGLVSGAVDTGANTFTFTHPLNASPADDLTATYRWSTDLQTFYNDGDPNGAGTTTVDFVQGTPSGGMVTVTATISGTFIPDKLFARLKVTVTTTP